MLSISQVVIATFIAAGVTFATRVLPFVLFSQRRPPEGVVFIQKYIPPMTMVILVIYCLKDIDWTNVPVGAVTMIPVIITAALHIWKGNALISIFTGTGLYMVLIHLI